MTVDRYTKLVLTVIAVCLVWLSLGGPALITPVSAQTDGVVLRGWVDQSGAVFSFPDGPRNYDCSRRVGLTGPCPSTPRSVGSLPVETEQ
jgi:hypothetical protein